MAGRGEQWLVIRNERGEELVAALGDALVTAAPTSAGKRAGSVAGFVRNTERAAGGLPLRAMPDWARPIVAWLMPRIGPPRAGIRPRPGGDEGGGDGAPPPPRPSAPDAPDDTRPRLAPGGALRPRPKDGEAGG